MASPGWTRNESPFHEGELTIQSRLGIKDRMDRQGRRIIREYLLEQHQQFFAQLSIQSLGESEQNLIASSDTFFIATSYQSDSADSTQGVDVSHRGGKPGFVRIDDESNLTIPDFSGNGHFNTLGNLELNPHAGLLFIDFERGDLLYLTGTTEVIWSTAEVSTFLGAEQLIRFHLKQGYSVKASLPLRWSPANFSPFLQRTGAW